MKKITLKKAVVTAALVAMLPGIALAAAPKHATPAKEAVEACVGKKAGDKVEYATARGNKVSGTCEMVNGELAAVPAGKMKSK